MGVGNLVDVPPFLQEPQDVPVAVRRQVAKKRAGGWDESSESEVGDVAPAPAVQRASRKVPSKEGPAAPYRIPRKATKVDKDLVEKLIAFHDIDKGKTLDPALLDFLTKKVCSLPVGESFYFLSSTAANLADSFEDGVHEKIMSAKFVKTSLQRTGKYNFEVKDGKGKVIFECKDEDQFVDQILNRFVREYYQPLPPEGESGPSGAQEDEEDDDKLSNNAARNAQRKDALQVQ